MTYIIYFICIAIALISVVPLCIMFLMGFYFFPYAYWIGMQHCKGCYKNVNLGGIFYNVRNATILYKSWILHKAPVFR